MHEDYNYNDLIDLKCFTLHVLDLMGMTPICTLTTVNQHVVGTCPMHADVDLYVQRLAHHPTLLIIADGN
jgi:hypothetical protein